MHSQSGADICCVCVGVGGWGGGWVCVCVSSGKVGERVSFISTCFWARANYNSRKLERVLMFEHARTFLIEHSVLLSTVAQFSEMTGMFRREYSVCIFS